MYYFLTAGWADYEEKVESFELTKVWEWLIIQAKISRNSTGKKYVKICRNEMILKKWN
jgi:hypothetical protein